METETQAVATAVAEASPQLEAMGARLAATARVARSQGCSVVGQKSRCIRASLHLHQRRCSFSP